jgi:thiol-disulfide isomerase/thioredoxin
MIGGILLLGAILLWRLADMRLPLYVALFLIAVGGLAYGVILGQHEQAQGIAAVLCTSCVGIEEAPHEEPALSEDALSALTRLDTDVKLIVFYAPWCHTCPYAEAMVQQVAGATDHITYKFVNVDTNRDLAASNEIIRSNRTVVPAILRVDTGEVIFGIEDLEARLLDLLEVGQ